MKVLEQCTNLFGYLSEDCEQRLKAVLENPTLETWDDAHCIIIVGTPLITLWQAVIAVDPTFPRVGPREDFEGNRLTTWNRVPDQLTLYRAIRHATRREA